MAKMDEKDKLRLKMKYNQKLLKDFEIEELMNLEKNIYNNMDEYDKIQYEFNIINDKYINYNEFDVAKICRIIEDELIELMRKYEKEKNDELLNRMKKLISCLQILLDMDYGFYTSIKEFDNSFYDYINDICNKGQKQIKKGKGF